MQPTDGHEPGVSLSCATCGNEYEHSIEVTVDGRTYAFDCFECAIHKLAPACARCGCRILGHGIQAGEHIFCGAHCARQRGVSGVADRVGGHMVFAKT